MSPVVFIGIATVSAAWFLLSLRPGSLLGVAFTSADWGRLWRERHDSSLQKPGPLRSAGNRAFLLYGSIAALCTLGGAANNTRSTLFGAAVIAGLVAGYIALFVFTRAGSRTRGAA
jgi:hypothetical protein